MEQKHMAVNKEEDEEGEREEAQTSREMLVFEGSSGVQEAEIEERGMMTSEGGGRERAPMGPSLLLSPLVEALSPLIR